MHHLRMPAFYNAAAGGWLKSTTHGALQPSLQDVNASVPRTNQLASSVHRVCAARQLMKRNALIVMLFALPGFAPAQVQPADAPPPASANTGGWRRADEPPAPPADFPPPPQAQAGPGYSTGTAATPPPQAQPGPGYSTGTAAAPPAGYYS